MSMNGVLGLTQRSEGTVHVKDLESWRAGLLRVVLTGSGLVLVGAWLVLWLGGHEVTARTFEYLLLIGGLLSALGPYVSQYPRFASWTFVGSQFLPLAHAILTFGWAPAAVLWLLFLTLFAGLLIGRAAAFGVVGGASALFAIGGLIADGKVVTSLVHPPPPVLPALDTLVFSSWITATLVFICFTAACAWGVGRLLDLLKAANSHHLEQVNLLRERHALLVATQYERDEKARQLQEAQRYQMVAQLGRGFNQLFGETLGTVRRLKELRNPTAAQLRSLGEEIIASVQRTASRSQDVLALLRSHPDPASAVSLSHSVAGIAYRFRAQLGRAVTLEVDAPIKDKANVDETWLEQVLLNLLLNAQHALGDGAGKITVQVRRLELLTAYPSSCGTLSAGAYAVVRVIDTGPGISAESGLRVFEPFYTEWGPSHLGIGLTTVFEMLRKAGGSVEVERPGEGASVAVYIPLAPVNPDSSPPTDPPANAARLPLLWEGRALRNAAKYAAACTGLAMMAAEVQRWMITDGMLTHLTVGLPLIGVFTFIARGKLPHDRSLALFTGSVIVASLVFVTSVGFMAPAGIVALALATLLTRALGPRQVWLTCLAVASVGLLGAGLWHTRLASSALLQTSLAVASNWYRISVTVPSIVLIGAFAVMQVVDAARSSIAQLASLEASLKATESLLVREVQSVSNIDRITSRASDLEALGRITGAVAHDVNNSLQAITAWASTLVALEGADLNAAHHEAVVAIAEAVEHAEALLSDLDVSHLGPDQRSVVDLGFETRRVTRLLRALLGTRHELEIDAPDGATVLTNVHTLHRALFNLVANARDAMQTPGTCTITVTCTGGHVQLSVQDDGAGMDETTLQRLFEPQFTTKGTRGNGLGLSSVVKLLAESDGSADTWSRLNSGTRITLTFPRAPNRSKTEHVQGDRSETRA